MSDQIDRSAADRFVMPSIEVGTPVSFYPHANTNMHPMLAFVSRVSRTGRNIMLRAHSGAVFEGVRHSDDPKLQWNADHRENGCWDYTDEWKRVEKERQEIKDRLDALESSDSEKTSKKVGRPRKEPVATE
ncbi:MAG: hypothetical protein CMA83_01205 [Euryarchaeota archaeon]|jgi:hypothetical protein|nr:hypothetical protein [Euryarchaeota archaeon]|tara:strand:- start:2325 stop:2717 length:393 start_codon:yes stop_codon:yes gene_type:complete